MYSLFFQYRRTSLKRVIFVSVITFIAITMLNSRRASIMIATVSIKLETTNPHESIGTRDYNLKKVNSTTTFSGFSFYLMGDTPYRDWQEKRLELQISEMKKYVNNHPERNLSFTVHVGDIQKVGRTQCAEFSYRRIANLLHDGPLPTLVVPGDNDWYDCPNRTESFDLFVRYFAAFETRWHINNDESFAIKRSSKNRELFAFYKEGIVFIGVHLINAPIGVEDINSWNARMNINKKWVARTIQAYFMEYEIRGVIIIGHALRSPRTRPFFLSVANNFVNITHRQNLPVVYLHGDGHDWDVDTKLSHQLHWKPFRDIQCDQGGLADPLIIDVAPSVQGKLNGFKQRNDLELVIGKGLIRIDRQRGLYENPRSID